MNYRPMSHREERFWNFMMTTSLVLNIALIAFFLTLWIWQPKAWLFSLWIAICVFGGLWEQRKKS